jgi:HEAT repeat protein
MSQPRLRLVVLGAVVSVGVLLAVVALMRLGPTAGLKDPNPAVRVAAIRALPWQGGDPNLLIAALKDENTDVRLVAAERLGGQGPDGVRRAEALVEVLDTLHLGVRREAAESLCSIGPDSGPVLIRALADPRPRVRAGAALALGELVHKDSRRRSPGEVSAAVPLLLGLLSDKDPEVRRNAALTLGVLGRAQIEKTVPRLSAALRDEDGDVRAAAVEALASLCRRGTSGMALPEIVSTLWGALNDTNPKVRRAALSAVVELDERNQATAAACLHALRDEDAQVRGRAGNHLAWLATWTPLEPRTTVPNLEAALEDRRADVRQAAAEALGNMGRKATQAVPTLIRTLGDRDRFVRWTAAVALWEIDRRTRDTLPLLIAALHDDNWVRREETARVLGEMGPAARQAVPALLDARTDEEDRVRSAAEQALARIAPKTAGTPAAGAGKRSDRK